MNLHSTQTHHQTQHLTHEQLSDLLIDDPVICDLEVESSFHSTDADAARHLGQCPLCSAELAELRSGLCLLRSTSTALARHQHALLSTVPARRPTHPVRPLSITALAAVLFAAVLPFAHLPHRATSQSTPQSTPAHPELSDEALLEGINQDLAAPVPTAMQPLVDPVSKATTTSTPRKN